MPLAAFQLIDTRRSATDRGGIAAAMNGSLVRAFPAHGCSPGAFRSEVRAALPAPPQFPVRRRCHVTLGSRA